MVTINSTIISGAGAIPAIRPLLAGKHRLLLVTDGNIARLDAAKQIQAILKENNRSVTLIDNVPPEPSHHDVSHVLNTLDTSGFDLVVGIGGGSVLDVAKLLSVLCHPQSPGLDSLLAGTKPTERLTSLLIPATAGTGSEATPNAILAIPEQNTKIGIISPVLLPDYVALLPELTTSMPAHIASSTGIDALCHLIECFTATVANPVSDNAALIGLHKLLNNIEIACAEPGSWWRSWRCCGRLTTAALPSPMPEHIWFTRSHILSGANITCRTGWRMPFCWPPVCALSALTPWRNSPRSGTVPGADTRLSAEEKSHALVDYFAALVRRLNLPDNLETLGVPRDDIASLSDAALNVKRLMNNAPCQVNHDEVQTIYRTLFPQN